jgi:hypothetical protein
MAATAFDDRLEAEPSDTWPAPLPLRDELPPVLPFNDGMLPPRLRPWVADIGERMNCPTEFVAIPAMIAAGSLIGRRVGIRPQQRTTWLEVGNLWGCVVARPGSLKSPAASEALAPMRRLEMEAAEAHQQALADYKAAEALFKIEREAAEKAARGMLADKAKLDGRGLAIRALADVQEPEAPAAKRHMTSDATAEKLGEICAGNPNGIMVHRDELLSLLADLDHPEKASARGFFLTGWSGLDGYTFDRIMRGTVRVPAVNLSLYGTTQPSRLAGYVRDSIRRFDDGMVQRLQLLAWPDCATEFREADRYPDADARREAHQCYADLAKLDAGTVGAELDEFDGPGGVPFLRFAGDAQDHFSNWRADLERTVRGDDMPAPLVAHLAKYRGLIPRLALICHLAGGGTGPVSIDALRRALCWAEYLESHARRAYASTSLDNAEAARLIWRRIRKGELATPFTARDVQRRGWTGLNDKDRVAAGIDALLEAEWLLASKVEAGPQGGRPSAIYIPNPKALRQ